MDEKTIEQRRSRVKELKNQLGFAQVDLDMAEEHWAQEEDLRARVLQRWRDKPVAFDIYWGNRTRDDIRLGTEYGHEGSAFAAWRFGIRSVAGGGAIQ